MREFVTVTKALADETRLRLLMAVRDRELCVCQLIELVGLAPSTVSKHMAILRQAGLVESRKEGRWMYYRWPEPVERGTLAGSALAWVRESLSPTPAIRGDDRRMKEILKIDPERLCSLQLRGRK